MALEQSESPKAGNWWTRLTQFAGEVGLSAPERMELRIDRLERQVQDIERCLRSDGERSN